MLKVWVHLSQGRNPCLSLQRDIIDTLQESMLLVARKNLFSERTRLFISVGGVALSVFL